jgi:hypothetical protein
MRPVSRAFVALAAGVLATTLVPAPGSAAPPTSIKPATLPRGGDVAIAHLEGKVVVDGSVRIRIKAPTVRLLGPSGTAYVVGTAGRTGGHARLFRVTADGTRTNLGQAPLYQTELTDDGQNLAITRYPGARKSVVTIRSATTGATVASRTFKGYVNTLDADGDRVLVGSPRGTQIWNIATGSVDRVTRLAGYQGDLSADVLAGYTKDPYAGGCTILTRLSTGERLWKSCKERVQTVNSDGTRMATIDLLSDGIGPARVWVRTTTGTKVGAYDIRGWFGAIDFETPTALLLEAHGQRKTATVRCTGSTCERASDLSVTVQPRLDH